MIGASTDPVVALVETCEASAIDANVVDRADRESRIELRAALLDAFAESKRAQRIAELATRLDVRMGQT